MLVYPFDPQCRLASNWIANEQLVAFPSSATRTVVPAHAPFFWDDCIVKKNGVELTEGEDFYFSLEHKVASYNTARRVYGGITLINDDIVLPLSIDYHLQGGAFEATASQVKQYLDTAPDVWDGSWEVLLGNTYYPPVKILYDPEAFVSEPEIIAACKAIEAAITAKDETESISYQTYLARLNKIKEDIDRLNVDEHTSQMGNVHGTQYWQVGALGEHDVARNTKRMGGKDLAAFCAYVSSVIGDLSVRLEGKFKNGDNLVTDSKLTLDGTLLLGDNTTLTMNEDELVHLGDRAVTLIADKNAQRSGTRATLNGGGNTLSVVSTGAIQDDRKLLLNDIETVTSVTLRAYANAILASTSFTLSKAATASMYFAGAGTLASPVEVIATIPSATEDSDGIVKIVNEGSHGFPCPGYGGTNFYVFYRGNGLYAGLRNGADDLEFDVFINDITVDPLVYTPSAERFRPAGLPVTAKPTYVRHGTEDCVWLDTTDGPFILLTNRNPDYNTWKCVKVLNPELVNIGYYGTPFIYNGKLYVVRSVINPGQGTVEVWEATIPTGATVSLTAKVLTGTNNNYTAQNGTVYKLFDKMFSTKGDAKCYAYNDDDFYNSLSISHSGDQYDYVQENGQVRFCHSGWHYMRNNGAQYQQWASESHVINLVTGVITPDTPSNYPIRMTQAGLSFKNPRGPLTNAGGNPQCNGKRANGRIFAFLTYGRLMNPVIRLLTPSQQISDFENARWNNQYYYRPGEVGYLGAYAGPLHSGIRGVLPIGQNRLVGICMDNSRVQFKYDPFGSYAPDKQGYGPTNDRVKILDGAFHADLSNMVWYYDGDNTTMIGATLNRARLSGNSSYANDDLGTPISITEALFTATRTAAVTKYAIGLPGPVYDSMLRIMVHRNKNVPQMACLQVAYSLPDSPTGQKQTQMYVFEITPNVSNGPITSIALGALLYSAMNTETFTDFGDTDFIYTSPSHIYRLQDGGHAVCVSGSYVAFIGNGHVPSVVLIYNALGQLVGDLLVNVNQAIGTVWLGTKELGYGFTYISDSGEGLYLDSYGFTVADILAVKAGSLSPTRYTLAMSRSDAGDNVVISQYAGNEAYKKVQSLIPPARKVQNMDLSADRTITKAMLAGSGNIPNTADANYPVQQKHLDTLASKVLLNHTHPAGDFTMALATSSAYGKAMLSSINGYAGDAVSAAALGVLDGQVSSLFSRQITLRKLDTSLTIDYEV